MKNLKILASILIILFTSRLIPHPPNFTILIALSFYVPILFGRNHILSVVLSFAITDIYFGLHTISLFTWFSVFIVGFLASFIKKNIFSRILGASSGALIFFGITNFAVWFINGYDHNGLSSLIETYILGIPFLFYNIFSTLIFSVIFEIIYWIVKFDKKNKIVKFD